MTGKKANTLIFAIKTECYIRLFIWSVRNCIVEHIWLNTFVYLNICSWRWNSGLQQRWSYNLVKTCCTTNTHWGTELLISFTFRSWLLVQSLNGHFSVHSWPDWWLEWQNLEIIQAMTCIMDSFIGTMYWITNH